MWSEAATAGAVKIGGAEWSTEMSFMLLLGVLVLIVCVILQVIFSVLRNDLGGLGQALLGVVWATVGAFAAIVIVEILLALTTDLTNGALKYLLNVPSWNDLSGYMPLAKAYAELETVSWGPTLILIASLLMIPAAFMVWLAMVARKIMIVLTMVFVFIAFGGAPFEKTRKWKSKWIGLMLALIFSELLMALVFCTGIRMLDGMGGTGTGVTNSITQVFAAVLLISMAGLSPWGSIKMVHFLEEETAAAIAHGRSVHDAGHSGIKRAGSYASKGVAAATGLTAAQLGASFFNRQFGSAAHAAARESMSKSGATASPSQGSGDNGNGKQSRFGFKARSKGEDESASRNGNTEDGLKTPNSNGNNREHQSSENTTDTPTGNNGPAKPRSDSVPQGSGRSQGPNASAKGGRKGQPAPGAAAREGNGPARAGTSAPKPGQRVGRENASREQRPGAGQSAAPERKAVNVDRGPARGDGERSRSTPAPQGQRTPTAPAGGGEQRNTPPPPARKDSPKPESAGNGGGFDVSPPQRRSDRDPGR